MKEEDKEIEYMKSIEERQVIALESIALSLEGLSRSLSILEPCLEGVESKLENLDELIPIAKHLRGIDVDGIKTYEQG